MVKHTFIEFSGMPKSGKTTINEIISHSLKRSGYLVKEFHGGGRYAPISKKNLDSLNIWLANFAVQFIVEMSVSNVDIPTHFILDRGIFDRCIFTKALYRMDLINFDTYNRIINYLTMPFLASKIDCVYLFITDPVLSIEREYKNKIIEKPGVVMNTEFLTLLKESSIETVDELGHNFKNIVTIDTEIYNGKIEETAKIVLNNIIEAPKK